MIKSFVIALALISTVASFNLQQLAIDLSLQDRIPRLDKRYDTFQLTMELAAQRGAKNWVETGTSRRGNKNCIGDGCSTVVFGNYLQFLNDPEVHLDSVDLSEENCEQSKVNVKAYNKFVDVHQGDSVSFIQQYPKKIDLLYLDSWDYLQDEAHLPDPPCQVHLLKELKAAESKLHDNSIILLDDCNLYLGGKCSLGKQWLKSNGWTRVLRSYQEVWVKNTQDIDFSKINQPKFEPAVKRYESQFDEILDFFSQTPQVEVAEI